MASTRPSTTEQHTRGGTAARTAHTAAPPAEPFLPAGAKGRDRHPESGAAGVAGALFCARTPVTRAAEVCECAREGC